jgi:hypothetical protein
MHVRRCGLGLLVCAAGAAGAAGGARGVAAQATLAQAARAAETAWLAHDAAALVGRSSAVILQIPGADPSAALGRSQAVELLQRHFQSATERRVTVAVVREVEAGRGFVELERRYVVPGTDDERRETVFLGYRAFAGRWLLVEVRTAR